MYLTGKIQMIFTKHPWLIIITLLLFLSSCIPKHTHNLAFSDTSNITKVYFGQNKDAIQLEMFYWRRGTFFLYHDFSFDKRLIVDIHDAHIWYKGYGLAFNFTGKDINKDTLHIDGDENITTAFSVPFKVQVGDTLTLRLDNFLYDEEGKEYTFKPIYLIVSQYKKTNK